MELFCTLIIVTSNDYKIIHNRFIFLSNLRGRSQKITPYLAFFKMSNCIISLFEIDCGYLSGSEYSWICTLREENRSSCLIRYMEAYKKNTTTTVVVQCCLTNHHTVTANTNWSSSKLFWDRRVTSVITPVVLCMVTISSDYLVH